MTKFLSIRFLVLMVVFLALLTLSASTALAKGPSDPPDTSPPELLEGDLDGEGGDTMRVVGGNAWNCRGWHSGVHASVDVPGTIDATQKTWCPHGFQPDRIGAFVGIYRQWCLFGQCGWVPTGSVGIDEKSRTHTIKVVAVTGCRTDTFKSVGRSWMWVDGDYYSRQFQSSPRTIQVGDCS